MSCKKRCKIGARHLLYPCHSWINYVKKNSSIILIRIENDPIRNEDEQRQMKCQLHNRIVSRAEYHPVIFMPGYLKSISKI